MTSGPALAIWNRSAPVVLSSITLARIPGNKIYYSLGVLSFVLGVPATLKTFYALYTWMKGPSSSIPQENEKKVKEVQKYPRSYQSLPIRKGNMITAIKVMSQTRKWFPSGRLTVRF